VRFRIDGVLQEMKGPPKRLQPSIISRLKLMAEVSLAEKRIPQDGRIQARTGGRDIDLRVSVLPTVYGESIVMRILDKEGLKLGLRSWVSSPTTRPSSRASSPAPTACSSSPVRPVPASRPPFIRR
jgi:type II secretory ATPase GspE/PulE/Tfp pilus assembly ATPase PilB-like protein